MKPDELDLYISITEGAFAASPFSMTIAWWPNGFTPACHTVVRRRHEKDLSNQNIYFHIIRDEDDHPVGTAKWEIQHSDMTLDQFLDVEHQKKKVREAALSNLLTEDVNFEAYYDYLDSLSQSRSEIFQGKAHIYFHVLTVHPDHQRKGVGMAGIQWGIEKADKLGLPIYLEGSPVGKDLYKKVGFEIRKKFPFDVQKYYPRDTAVHYTMVREPVVSRGGKIESISQGV
ncbi:hypothetical protein ABW19_dt0204056 [Dactylella cylindrospora]|nr:hypothetical protein ABW19_dt0204056 [Dactylella cylindrospora]